MPTSCCRWWAWACPFRSIRAWARSFTARCDHVRPSTSCAWETHVLSERTRIFRALRASDTPLSNFSTNTMHLLEGMAGAGSDVISVAWRLPLDEAWTRVGAHLGIQGNLEPAALIGSFDVAASEARTVLARAAGRPGHIFNLGHGVLPQTPSDSLRRLVELVHAETAVA